MSLIINELWLFYKIIVKLLGKSKLFIYIYYVINDKQLNKNKMANLENQLEKLVNEFGIEAVMGKIKTNHADKVFIPNWYYQEHLEEMGFEFDDEYNDMCAFSEFMEDGNIYELTNQLVSEDYPELWEEYKEENQ